MASTNSFSGSEYTSLGTLPAPKRGKRLWASWSSIGQVVDWRVPGVMSLCFLLGIASAVGHDLFYRHWNGQSIDSAAWSQQWISRGGTAFAFLVKMFLAVATGIAYVQHFWVMVQSRPIRVSQVDAMFDVLGNPLQLLDVRLWSRSQ